jgi:hypothetical protein
MKVTVCLSVDAGGAFTVSSKDFEFVNAGLGYKLEWTGPLGKTWGKNNFYEIN